MKLKLLILSFFLVFSFIAKSQSLAIYGKTSFGTFTFQRSFLTSLGLELVGKGKFSISPRIGISHIYTNIVYSGSDISHDIGYEAAFKLGFRVNKRKDALGLDVAFFASDGTYGNGSGEFVFAPTIFVSGSSIIKKVDIGANFGPMYSLNADGFGMMASLFFAYKFL